MAKPALQYNSVITPRQLWAVAALMVLALILGYATTGANKRLPTDSPRVELETVAQILDKADRTGDRGLAGSLVDRMQALMWSLERNPLSAEIPARRSCMLAASQLAQGVMAVAQEGHWLTRERYAENIKDCQ